jgi:MoaA/NifB/PqqE/SkfB family radical SAM enzyme
MVGGLEGYTLGRNRALELLVEAGFNKSNPTRLCLAANPVTIENYNEMFEIYKWGRVRNLYVIICPTMVSGRCAVTRAWKEITPPQEELIDLYVKIYNFNIQKGIQTLKQIEEEGISAYAGGCPCHQVACGMYVTLGGIVLRCPGDAITLLGDMKKSSLRDIWMNSENYKRAGTFNCGCPPKMGKTFDFDFFDKALSRLKESRNNL